MASGRSDITDIACDLIHETEKAYKVRDGDGKEHWLPKSQCEYDTNDKTFAMPTWLAKEKGLI